MSENGSSDVVQVRLYYDFASTLCYVAHRVLTGAESRIRGLGVELEWCPIDLTMIVPWDRGDSFSPEIRAAIHATAATLGIDVEMPDPWLDSRPASNVALSLRSAADEARWRQAVFTSIFEQRHFELAPELLDLARQLTGSESLPQDQGETSSVVESTRGAILLGIEGVPTLLLDDLRFGGIHDAETMIGVLEQLLERYRQGDGGPVN